MNLKNSLLLMVLLAINMGFGVDPYALNFFNYYMGAQYFMIEEQPIGTIVYLNPNLSRDGKELLYENLLLPLLGKNAICVKNIQKDTYGCVVPKKKVM